MGTTYAPGYNPRPTRPLEPGEAAKSQLAGDAWQYAQQFPLGQQASASLTYMKQHDPSFQVPTGYTQNDDGTIEVDRGSWLSRNWSYLALAAVTGGIGISLLPAAATAGAVPGVTVASTAGPSTAANLAATASIAGGSSVPPALAAAGSATVGSAADILKYVVPTAGDLVKGLIQTNAAGDASAAQQKYLEEALAYEKEKDAYQRTVDATAVATANSRYAGYQDRIAPFIANGTSSNDRMSALLGLAPRSGSSSGGGGSSSGGSQGVPVTPEITAKLAEYYRSLGLTPTGPGTGPTDIEYMAKQIAATGGLTPDNVSYWLDPSANGRITQELTKAGIKTTPTAPATTPPATSPPATTPPASAAGGPNLYNGATPPGFRAGATPPTPPPLTTQPQVRAADVQMRGPDGSVKTVTADQVDHYKQLGATVLGAAA